MSCTIVYKDQEFENIEKFLEYANENNISDILDITKTPEDNNYLQKETQSALPSNDEINKKIESFLETIGVKIQSVDLLRDSNGKALSAVAKADMLNKVIQIIDKKADITTLPEEAAHFFVELLGDGHPLLKEMMSKITGYKLYPDVVNQYKGNKAYKNQDGTINFDKIKKEAIGKLIALHVIQQESGSELDSKLTAAMNWWAKLLDFLTKIFSKSKENPFTNIAESIRNNDISDLDLEISSLKEAGEYFQIDESLDKLLADQDKIQLDNSIDPVSGQKRHIYTYDGVKAKGSVTSAYVDPAMARMFKSDRRSEKQKEIDLLKAEVGDVIHEEMQNIVKSWTNGDGTIKDTQTPHEIVTTKDIYNKLNNYIVELLSTYEDGTIIKSEVMVYDKKTKIAGSIDFLAIKPDGSLDIYDWKSQEISKYQDDLKSYKEPAYRIQLENYKKILELEYGFRDFDKIRAIPIKTEYIYNKGEISHLKDIEIGNLDPTQIPDDKNYLLPVTLKNAATGNEDLDDLIKKLNGIYDKIELQKVSKDERQIKYEELGKLKSVMRDLQLRGKVDKLIEFGLIEYNKYSEKLKKGTLTSKDIINAPKILQVFSDSGIYLFEALQDLKKAAKEDSPEALEAYNEISHRFTSMTNRTGKLISDLRKYTSLEADKFAKADGITGLLKPEAPVGALNAVFAGLDKITQKSFQLFASMLRDTNNIRDARFDVAAEKLLKLEESFIKYNKSKGLSYQKAMEKILNIDEKGNWNGNFLSKYKPEFSKLKDEAIKSGDTKWLLENLEFTEENQERYKIQEAKQIEYLTSIQFALDEVKNKKTLDSKIAEWKLYNNVEDDKGNLNTIALLNPANTFLTPKESWKSEKWIELNKSENKPLKEMYDYFQEQIRYAEKLGMLDRYSPGFIPTILAGKVEQLVFGNTKDFFSINGFFRDLEVDSGTKYTPEVDPTDGSIINSVPVYYTNDTALKNDDGTYDYTRKSRNLFKVFGIWSAHMYGYEAMERIEDTATILLEAERNKGSLVTDRWGNVVIKDGKVQAIDTNDKNSKLLEDFVNFYIYKRVGDVSSDVKFTIAGKDYSLLKTLGASIDFFRLKTLAFNPLSGTAQFVGGTSNALFQAQKGIFFTKKMWAKGMYLATSDAKMQSALHYFNTHMSGNQGHLLNNLSLSTATKVISTDSGYILSRLADMAVENPIAATMLLTHMLDENNMIVSIDNVVKAKYNYNDTFYTLSKEDQKLTRDKIDKEVKKLQDTKSLYHVGEFKDDKYSLPQISKEAKTFGEFRGKVKGVGIKILGNSSQENINHLKTTMFGMSLSTFRSWIPGMIEERFAGLKYDKTLQGYTYGKVNLFFSELFSKRAGTILKSVVTGFGADGIQAASDKYESLKRDAYEKGQDFNISKGEFTDLYFGNIRSQLLEMMVLIAFGAAILSVSGGGDDDKNKGLKKYANRALRKYYNEFAFYYNPIEFTNLVKSPIPVIGLAEDFIRFSSAFGKQVTGVALGKQDWIDQAKPAKYFFRMVPVAKEALLVMATFDDQFRKDWDIKVN